MNKENIWVSIVEDKDRFRKIYSMIIESAEGFKLVSQYSNCEQAIENIVEDNPEVILMDIELGEGKMSGIEAVRIIKEKLPKTDIIMLSVHEDNEDYIFDSLCAGASGYLTKDIEPDLLLQGISHTFEGGSPMSPVIARRVVGSFRKKEFFESELSENEKRVLSLAADDKIDKEIAEILNITRDTVRYYFKSIYVKLQVHSKHGAIAKAIREGWV